MKYMPRSYDLFDDVFDDFFRVPSFNNMGSVMKTDVREKDGYYYLDVELPGYNKEDVNIEISDGYLNIKASHNADQEEKDSKGNLIRQERSFGSCSRSFYVGENIHSEDIQAKFNNGVLEISLPSKEQKRIQTAENVQIQ